MNKSGFSRVYRHNVFRNHPQTYGLGEHAHYVAGLSDDIIYLANSGYSGLILCISDSLTRMDTLYLKLPDSLQIAWAAARMNINYPKVYLTEGITPAILRYTFPFLIYTCYHPKTFVFDHSVWIDDSMFVYRTRPVGGRRILYRQIVGSSFSDSIIDLINSGSGIFSSDGFLMYDNFSGRLVYVYYYSNTFLVADVHTTGAIKYKSIDTITTPKLSADTILSQNRIVPSSPPVFVNRHCSVDNGLLYIHSLRRADNEMISDFDHFSVIDVYEIDSGKYFYSFYLPVRAASMRSFHVKNNSVIVLQNKQLSRFTFRKVQMKN